MVFWDGDMRRPGGRMILCRDKTDIGGGGDGAGGGCTPQKDIGRQEERERWVNNIYVTISDGGVTILGWNSTTS